MFQVMQSPGLDRKPKISDKEQGMILSAGELVILFYFCWVFPRAHERE